MATAGKHPGRRSRYLETIDFVARGMDYLCGRTTEFCLSPVSTPAPILPGNLRQVQCKTRIVEGNNVPTPRPPPVASTREVIQPILTDFWATFTPDEPDPEELPEEPLDDLWNTIRLLTAPWGADDWELPTPPDSLVDDDGSGISHTSNVSIPSLPDEGVHYSEAPLRVDSRPEFTCWSLSSTRSVTTWTSETRSSASLRHCASGELMQTGMYALSSLG